MRRIAFSLFLLFVSMTAVAAEVPSASSGNAAAVPPAFPVVDRADAGAVLSALLAGRQQGSCAARTDVPADVPVVLARPIQDPAAKGTGEPPRICCDCLGDVCCPQRGSCVLCGDFGCLCCSPL